jgi:hypothetical protein
VDLSWTSQPHGTIVVDHAAARRRRIGSVHRKSKAEPHSLPPADIQQHLRGDHHWAHLLRPSAQRQREPSTSRIFLRAGTQLPTLPAVFISTDKNTQDTIYGRGFTTLSGNALALVSADPTAPVTNLTLDAMSSLGDTASGLADEDTRLSSAREQLMPGSLAQPLCPSQGTLDYVAYMRNISVHGSGFEALICSWTMGQVSHLINQRIFTSKNPPKP